MANSYFSFKQFTIHQERSAMKVCTDACILGAWTATKIENNNEVKNILDIGTGTGLLSLMLAQKSNARIDAVELNEDAASQAIENIGQSPWSERIQVFNSKIQQFDTANKYDLIISNPPFFEDDLRSDDHKKNDAKHDTALTLQELLNAIKKNLSETGFASILIPYNRTVYFKNIAEIEGLFINEILKIKQSPTHSFFRSVIILAGIKKEYKEEILIINDEQRQYPEAFKALLKDYYLNL
jgi:tRNA1Val (adenine37-N6)-methyltransferase